MTLFRSEVSREAQAIRERRVPELARIAAQLPNDRVRRSWIDDNVPGPWRSAVLSESRRRSL